MDMSGKGQKWCVRESSSQLAFKGLQKHMHSQPPPLLRKTVTFPKYVCTILSVCSCVACVLCFADSAFSCLLSLHRSPPG